MAPAAEAPLTACVVSRAFSDHTNSGLVRASVGLAEGLARAGHRVHVLTRTLDAPRFTASGVTVHPIVAPPLLDPPELAGREVADHLSHAAAVHRTVTELDAAVGIDAVVSPLWCCEGIVCALDDRLTTVVSCMTSMTTICELRPDVPPSRLELDLIALERVAVREATALHGLAERSLRKALSDYDRESLHAAVIPRGIADRAGHWSAAPDHDGPVRVLYVGRLERRKGVDVLLEAVRHAVEAGADLELTVVGGDMGDGPAGVPYRDAFERGAGADPAVGQRVRFAGTVDDAELDRLYRRADLVCVPSRYESHGIVAVEAMMYGRPVVAAAAGGTPDVLEEGGNALLAQPGDPASLADCLARLAADPELRRRLGVRSRERYEERFEPAVVGALMGRFLAEVAASRPAPGDAGDLHERLAAVLRRSLDLEDDVARAGAGELLSPSPDAWRIAAEQAAGEAGAWQARALEAERQRRAVEAGIHATAPPRRTRSPAEILRSLRRR
jgi:glycosyltransferase involved in cell wall biosynthesis